MSNSQTPPTGATPNKATPPPSLLRRRKPVDPLVRKKPNRPGQRNAPSSAPRANGTANPNVARQIKHTPLQKAVIAQNQTSQTAASDEPYVDYPITTTKRELLKDLRHHVMRLLPNSSAPSQHVDPSDEAQFTRPVRLHRRDPRYNPVGNWDEGEGEVNGVEEDPKALDEAERARYNEAKAQRQAQREAIEAETAPIQKPVQPQKKKNHFQKKTEQVFQVGDTERNDKNMKLRYEEAIPWHLEDFDNKNIWSGVYEASLSERHIMLLQDRDSKSYRMVPLEKWYKFSAKNQFKHLSIEEAEARMSKKLRDPRWFMDTQRAAQAQFKQEFERQPTSRLLTRRGERGERPGRVVDGEDNEAPENLADANDIDYDYDEAFADDEENPLFGGDDEENKEAEEKIKRERLEANIFELKEEKDHEQEEEEAERKQEEERKKAKKIKKALLKKEKNYIYESDSDKNPYSSSSESEDSETERLKEEERRKKEEEEKTAAQDKSKLSDREKPSGSSSKGTNTPTGRPKAIDPLRKKLKRSGSPSLSDASGNESSRKKLKNRHSSSQPIDDTGSRAASISRPSSPSNVPTSSAPPLPHRKSSIIKLPVDKSKLNDISSTTPRPAGSGSDGETSDGAGFRRKHKIGSGNPSPRSGTPNGSRAGSPARQPGSPRNDPDAPVLPFTPEEILGVIPEEGRSLKEILRIFKGRTNHPSFTTTLKQVATMDKETKLVKPKKQAATTVTNAASTSTAAAGS